MFKSIRTSILIVPLVLIFLGVVLIGAITSIFMENTLIEEIDKRGNQVLSQTMKHLEYEGTIATEDYQREVELL